MTDYKATSEDLTAVANAIRQRGGTSAPLTFPDGFVAAIQNIPGWGTDKWVRPSDWPDYSQIDISGEEACYFTYLANTENSFACIQITATGTYSVSVGVIENGAFSALTTETFTASAKYYKSLTGYSTDYVVVRIAGTITRLQFASYASGGIDNNLRAQTCVEIYGRVPHLGNCTDFVRNMVYVESVTLIDAASISTLQRFGAETKRLTNVDISGVTSRISAYLAFSSANGLRYLYLHGIKLSNVQNICQSTKLMYSDLEGWDVVATCTMANAFNGSLLRKLDLSGWNMTASAINSIFQDCLYLEEVDISTWTISGSMANAFRNTAIKHFPAGDFSRTTNTSNLFYSGSLVGDVIIPETTATSLEGVVVYCDSIKTVTIPANYTTIPANCFRDTRNLQEIHFLATTPPTLANANAFSTNVNSSLKIYVPYSADHSVLNAYKTATNWSTHASIIVEEPAP